MDEEEVVMVEAVEEEEVETGLTIGIGIEATRVEEEEAVAVEEDLIGGICLHLKKWQDGPVFMIG
jgi:hypothetical protein